MAITVVTKNDKRTYKAEGWTVGQDQTLNILDGSNVVAEYAPGGWEYVLQADSETPDPMPS
jgi:hypothetical protein